MKIKELFDIQGKKFFITGGHTGVGRMIAEGVIKNGGQVVICGREFKHEIQQLGGFQVERLKILDPVTYTIL